MNARKVVGCIVLVLLAFGSVGSVLAQDVSLIFWDTMNDQERVVMEEIVRACEADLGYSVDYQYVPFDQAQSTFRTAAQAGEAPDILRTEIAWAPEFAALGYLYDITDLVTEEERASYLEAPFNYVSYNGRVWGLPQVTDAPALLYNKALFTEAGLDPENPPQTMDELKETALAISALGDDTFGIAMPWASYPFQAYMWAFGGGLIDPEDMSIHINDQGTVDAFAFVQSLIDEGAMSGEFDPANQYGNSLNQFKEGSAGMIFMGPWATTDVLTGAAFADDPDNLGVAAIPAGPAGQGSPVGGHEYTIYAGSPFPEESLEFIRCLNQPENQVRLASELNLIPTVRAAYDDPELQENTLLQGFLAQMEVATNRPVIPAGGQIYTELDPRFQAVILGEQDAQEAMDAVAEAWQQLIDQQPQPQGS